MAKKKRAGPTVGAQTQQTESTTADAVGTGTELTPGQAMDALLRGGRVTADGVMLEAHNGLICEVLPCGSLRPRAEYINAWTLRRFGRA